MLTVLVIVLYFGWPIIQTMIVFSPIPDPKDVKNQAVGWFKSLKGMLGFLVQCKNLTFPNTSPTSTMLQTFLVKILTKMRKILGEISRRKKILTMTQTEKMRTNL